MSMHLPGWAGTGRIALPAFLLLLFSCIVSAADGDDGRHGSFPAASADNKEGIVKLPPYPVKDRLVQVPASLSGYDFSVFIDRDSLATTGQGEVRYTLVIISSSGVWNTSYEGMQCGKGEYRRYAYGSDNRWHPIVAASWQPVVDRGMEHYRYVLYWNYLCDPLQSNVDVGDMLSRIRHAPAYLLPGR